MIGVLSGALEDFDDLLFEEAAAFFDHVKAAEADGELGDEDGVERVGHADLEDGEVTVEAEFGEGVAEVTVGGGGGDKAQAGEGVGLAGGRGDGEDAVGTVAAGTGPEALEAFMELLFLAPGARRQEYIALEIDAFGVERDAVVGADERKLIGADDDGAASIRLVGGHQVADVQLALAGQPEGEVDPVLELLRVTGFKHRHHQVPGQETRVGRDLRRVAPRVIAKDDDRAAFGVGADEVAEGEGVGGDVDADAFLDSDGAEAMHLGAVNHGGCEGLVVGHGGADPVVAEELLDVLGGVEESGDG
ncbi:MAG: hypothetical protein M5U12_07365 [Verrucomicrobia bacterium]|nr:hypothetical protein [Verrucomicrobiota bacterium]